jgi:hypothetical protein
MDSIQGFWKFGDGSHNRSATPWLGLRSAILTLLLLRDELRAMTGIIGAPRLRWRRLGI